MLLDCIRQHRLEKFRDRGWLDDARLGNFIDQFTHRHPNFRLRSYCHKLYLIHRRLLLIHFLLVFDGTAAQMGLVFDQLPVTVHIVHDYQVDVLGGLFLGSVDPSLAAFILSS